MLPLCMRPPYRSPLVDHGGCTGRILALSELPSSVSTLVFRLFAPPDKKTETVRALENAYVRPVASNKAFNATSTGIEPDTLAHWIPSITDASAMTCTLACSEKLRRADAKDCWGRSNSTESAGSCAGELRAKTAPTTINAMPRRHR